MFGFRSLPARGFFVRHADRVLFRNVTVRALAPDDRPDVVALDSDLTRRP